MVNVRRIIYPVLLTTCVIVIAFLYPLAIVILSAGAFVFLVLFRQLNFYRVFLLLKHYARYASKLCCEVRTRIRLGIRSYYDVSLDGEESLRRSSHGYVR